ncbi:MAG: GGDEF domain-containing protein, partial [Desulfarculus sp.]|nr:GGDEF domain-containing protein [Desulfarculus sp.]
GFEAGDKVILLMGRILVWALRRHGGPDAFVGHVGGDDFVVITTPERAERVCRAVTRCFARLVPHCYSPEDRRRGFVLGKDRNGNPGQFPLISVSMAIVDCLGRCDLGQISQRAAEVKRYAKSLPGNVYVRDRRLPLGDRASAACPAPLRSPNLR